MSLHERRDFRDLLLTVGERSGAGAAIVEKDYWVTEALRVISREFGDGVVFKGGTSLSKGWHLISRFSEDIDLLIRTSDGDSHGQRDRYMKEIDEAVERLPGLTGAPQGRRSDRGVSRTAAYAYESQAPALAGLASTISLEMGIRGGPHPIERRELDSILAEHLRHSGLENDELETFQLDLLDYRRTFLEKLFAIHSAATRHLEGDAGALNRQGRHYYDIYYLLAEDDVVAFAGSDDYRALAIEIDTLSQADFPGQHRAPVELRFSNSPALDPGSDIQAALALEYERNRFLYYGGFPTFDEIHARLDRYREIL